MRNLSKTFGQALSIICISFNAQAISLGALKSGVAGKLSGKGFETLTNVLEKYPTSKYVHITSDANGFRSLTRYSPDSTGKRGWVDRYELDPSTGTITDLQFKRPLTATKPNDIAVSENTFFSIEGAPGTINLDPFRMAEGKVVSKKVTTITDTYKTNNGEIRISNALEVRTFKSKDLPPDHKLAKNDVGDFDVRIQSNQFIDSPSLKLASSLTHSESGSQISFHSRSMDNFKKADFRGNIHVPKEDGLVIGYSFNSTGDQLTVQTLSGKEIEFTLKSDRSKLLAYDSGNQENSKLKYYKVDSARTSSRTLALHDFIVVKNVIAGRTPSKVPARGIEIEINPANPSAAQ